MRRTRPEEIRVGDCVRRSENGRQMGVLWIVEEIEEKRWQDYWGYWYSWMTVKSLTSRRRNRLRTVDVVVMPPEYQRDYRYTT